MLTFKENKSKKTPTKPLSVDSPALKELDHNCFKRSWSPSCSCRQCSHLQHDIYMATHWYRWGNLQCWKSTQTTKKAEFSFGPVPSCNSTSSLPSPNGGRMWQRRGEMLSAATYTWINSKQMWDWSLNGSKRKVHTIPTLPPASLLLLPALAAPPIQGSLHKSLTYHSLNKCYRAH